MIRLVAAVLGLCSSTATAQQIYQNDRYDVTYAPVGSDWYVLSGTTADGAIVYTRTQSLTACDGRLVYGTMLFEYDAAEKAAIDPLIGPATRTLVAAPCN